MSSSTSHNDLTSKFEANGHIGEHSPQLSLSSTFQPAGIRCVESCRFMFYGRYTDWYKADIYFFGQFFSLPVVAKAFRVLLNDQNGRDRLNRMLSILQGYWSTVANGHGNISPIWLASVTTTGITAPALVTPHYRNGNAFEYLRLHPNADRFIIICQAASALAYIHSKGVVHGNICPENVCIADDNMVRMTDMGVDTLIRQMSPHAIPSNWMYKSGEELENGIRTLPTDVYSFACTIFSIYNLKPPFPPTTHSYGKRIMQIANQGHEGIFAESKPAEMSDQLWKIIGACWAKDPSQRPLMSEVESKLRSMC